MAQEGHSRTQDRAQTQERAAAVAAHIRLTNPDATPEERRAAQQARVGILRNPAEPKLATPPPRDVWRKWPRLRSARRTGTVPPREMTGRRMGDSAERPLPEQQALQAETRALRQALQVHLAAAPADSAAVATPRRPATAATTGPAPRAAARRANAPRQQMTAAPEAATPITDTAAPRPQDMTPEAQRPPARQPWWQSLGIPGAGQPWPQRLVFVLSWGLFCAVLGGVMVRLVTGG